MTLCVYAWGDLCTSLPAGEKSHSYETEAVVIMHTVCSFQGLNEILTGRLMGLQTVMDLNIWSDVIRHCLNVKHC